MKRTLGCWTPARRSTLSTGVHTSLWTAGKCHGPVSLSTVRDLDLTYSITLTAIMIPLTRWLATRLYAAAYTVTCMHSPLNITVTWKPFLSTSCLCISHAQEADDDTITNVKALLAPWFCSFRLCYFTNHLLTYLPRTQKLSHNCWQTEATSNLQVRLDYINRFVRQ